MSGRALRLLLEEKERAKNGDGPEEEREGALLEEEEERQAPAKRSNLFLLLQEDDDDDDGDDDHNDDEDDDENDEDCDNDGVKDNHDSNRGEDRKEREVASSEVKQETPEPTSTSRSEGKKKKRKRKKKGRRAQEGPSEEDLLLDAAVAEAQSAAAAAAEMEEDEPEEDALLGVESVHLDAAHELKRLFGSAAAAAPAPAPAIRRRGRKMVRQVRATHRPGKISRPLETWPPIRDEAMEMVELSDEAQIREEGVREFRIKHSTRYEMTYQVFLECVNSGNPNAVMDILMHYPYHVPALLQMAELFKQTGDFQKAGELIERALYAYEAGWSADFDWHHNKGRLRACYPENQGFFQALFRHIQLLGRRGCCRTGLECCKLLLSLDHSDPMFIVGTIDYYALRSKQYLFLDRLCEEFRGRSTFLPNLLYSRALAIFFLSQESDVASDKERIESSADGLLQEALVAFPAVLQPLLEKCNVSLFHPSTRERLVLSKEPLFSGAYQAPSLMQLVKIFVDKCYSLWSSQEVVAFLSKNTVAAVERMCSKELDEFCSSAERRVKAMFPLHAPDAFLSMDAADYNDEVAVIPAELLEDGGRAVQEIAQPQPPVVPAPTNNPLALFFRTLMPWNEVPNAPYEPAADADPALVQGLIDRFLQMRGAPEDEDLAPAPEEEGGED